MCSTLKIIILNTEHWLLQHLSCSQIHLKRQNSGKHIKYKWTTSAVTSQFVPPWIFMWFMPKPILHFWQCITIIRDNNFCLIFVLHYIFATNSWTLFTHYFPHNRELMTHIIIKATPSPFLSFLFNTQQCTCQPYHQQQDREVL